MSKNCDFIFAEIFQVLSLYNDMKNGLRRVLKISSEYTVDCLRELLVLMFLKTIFPTTLNSKVTST